LLNKHRSRNTAQKKGVLVNTKKWYLLRLAIEDSYVPTEQWGEREREKGKNCSASSFLCSSSMLCALVFSQDWLSNWWWLYPSRKPLLLYPHSRSRYSLHLQLSHLNFFLYFNPIFATFFLLLLLPTLKCTYLSFFLFLWFCYSLSDSLHHWLNLLLLILIKVTSILGLKFCEFDIDSVWLLYFLYPKCLLSR